MIFSTKVSAFQTRSIKRYLISLCFYIIFCCNLVYSENLSYDSEDLRRTKVKVFCENNPLAAKCKKYLDSEYRLHKDSEKETKEDRQERYSEQRYQKERNTELISFCRDMPDSSRCKVLQK